MTPRSQPATEGRIAIAGAGISGAYLYRLLAKRGTRADLFDRKARTRCGLRPCAWGTSRGFEELVRTVGLDPQTYILRRIPYVDMDEFRIPADLVTFDKPKLVADLLGDVEVRYDSIDIASYERLIDATGIDRAFLPSPSADLVLPCVQHCVRSASDLGNRILLGGIGYSWCFPLGEKTYHIGCGSVFYDPNQRLNDLGWVEGDGIEPLCSCSSRIRLTGPHGALPFVTRAGGTEIWGVGEAIGCVAPLAGDGIVAGMKSAVFAAGYWNDGRRYTNKILREFRWMKSERGVLNKLLSRRGLGLVDAQVLRRNSRRMGMEVSLRQATHLMDRLVPPEPDQGVAP